MAKVTNLNTAPTRQMQLGRGYQRLLVEGDGAKNVDVHVNHIKVGSGPGPYHYHARCENVYIVLEGTVEAVVDGVRYILGKDDVAFIPPGVPHSAGNGGEVEAVAIEIYSPPRNGDFNVVDPPTAVRDAPTASG